MARCEADEASVSLTMTLSEQPAECALPDRLPVHLGDGFGQRDAFRAYLHAILCVGAIGHAARLHHRREALLLMHRAGRMHIEQPHLADDRGADKIIVNIDLRADLESIAACDAARERIGLLLR